MNIINKSLAWVLNNKVVTVLSVLLFCFFISTISLAVQKNNAQASLRSCVNDYIECQDSKSSVTTPAVEETTTPAAEETTTPAAEETTTPAAEETTTPAAEETTTTAAEETTTTAAEETTTPSAEETPTPTTETPVVTAYRLPSYIVPITYELTLRPNIEEGTFTGTNRIDVKVSELTNTILIHSHTLSISSVVVDDVDGNIIPNEFRLLEEEERLEITLATSVPRNGASEENLFVTIDFYGSMEKRIVGLYKSTYFDGAADRAIATSKFEPTYARQAFPCFDEPAMKANYTITLEIPTGNGYHALSNMPVANTTDHGNGTTSVRFQESVKMSSYLACFIVSDFAVNSAIVQPGLEMRVFSTPAQLSKTEYPLVTGVNITRFYIEYFNVDYPLPKLDMAAIPDFVSGAMEHWGLVTFRETALLYESGISSTANKQRVATVIAHELAHMWFGNLVTMAWWDELWLNEGFASYIEYKGCEAAEPTWGMLEQFLIEDLHPVLNLDATLASHPIVQKVETPDQITEVFDTITYNKGAAVIRMMEDFVGENQFRQSVTNYLNNHAFGNAVTDDLLTEIDKLNLGFDIKHIMNTWTKQMGFPVVTVEKVSDTQYRLTQKRFFSNPDNANETTSESEYNYRWYIPITYQTDTNPLSRDWFNNADTQLTIDLPSAPRWIKFNKDQFGYYRVNYPEEMWTSLISILQTETETLSIADRAHLINDAFSLAEATLLPYETALTLTSYLATETQYVPWSVASTNLLNLKNRLNGEPLENFRKFAQTLIRAVYTTVGWTVDSEHLRNHLRTTVLNFACSVGLPECLEEAGNQFNMWLSNGTVPDPDLRNTIYYYGMATVGNAEKWEQVWNIYKQEADASEKAKLVYGLSAIKDHAKLSKFVTLAWNESNVRGQDYFTCMQNIAANPIGESIVWDYVRDNWELMVNRFGLNERYLGRMIPSICGRFSTKTKLEEVNAFFVKYPEAGAGAAARRQTIEDITNRIKWLENNQESVAQWLNENA
ncbi:glutamyl aminopeptidase isoform X2 [Bradysia coprophila]|uniref:glutamyl aminopeptidase isoform X2 n=1 Tax=Bradysia coprophila TaxID=38358 RepID=UPI00187D7952|nr:glutamyl aminopeptidase isoform X2 [Bradysia coprophila]